MLPAHCLNWDLISQGTSPNHAVAMLCEALSIAMEADEEDEIDSDFRPSAPKDCWDLFSQIQQTGVRIAPADAEHLPAARSVAYAMIIHYRPHKELGDDFKEYTPPPFVVQGLQRNSEASC